MPDHKAVYDQFGVMYERLVSREDYQGNILRTIRKITSLVGKDVVEMGSGTGRLTCLVAPHVHSIQAFDISQHMLDIAIDKLQAAGLNNWQARVSDHRSLAAADGCADLVISGWSICYLVDWNREAWPEDLDRALAEMRRVLRPGGIILLIETMGTGFETPHPPEHLTAYYQTLERKGFTPEWIRTDYQFASLDEAVELVQFFFGDDLAAQVRSAGSLILPECTGFWWQVVGTSS
jgi:ubiquinone/menaquinone biosynthesis C-methylase UbiE